MMPRKKPKGRSAFRRVHVFIGIPDEYRDKPTMKVPDAEASKLRCQYVTVAELSEHIGGPWRE
jgi:ribosomal protein L13